LKGGENLKQIKALLLLIVIFSMVTAVQAEVAQYETVSKMAEDTNCKAVCHNQDTHVIHESTSATCQGCHGATLTDRQPSCYNCHTGSIHNVHLKKVQTEDCSYCHVGLDSLHLEMMSDTLCAHCHGDLLDVHGGPTESCGECHGSAANIVSPVTSAGDIIVCQGCHASADVAVLHGEASDPNSCYMCHRPGSENVTASEIPHFIHVPDVACEKCHIDQGTEKIMIPECILCHSVETLHGYNQISLKTSSTGLKCSVCHPMVADDKPVAATPAPDDTTTTGPAEPDEGTPGTPGFGVLAALTSLAMLFVIRKIKN
jgi:hypothetical protein